MHHPQKKMINIHVTKFKWSGWMYDFEHLCHTFVQNYQILTIHKNGIIILCINLLQCLARRLYDVWKNVKTIKRKSHENNKTFFKHRTGCSDSHFI